MKCPNFNHGRMNVSIRFCPDCGERISQAQPPSCDDSKHVASRKNQGATYCCDCGKKIRQETPGGKR